MPRPPPGAWSSRTWEKGNSRWGESSQGFRAGRCWQERAAGSSGTGKSGRLGTRAGGGLEEVQTFAAPGYTACPGNRKDVPRPILRAPGGLAGLGLAPSPSRAGPRVGAICLWHPPPPVPPGFLGQAPGLMRPSPPANPSGKPYSQQWAAAWSYLYSLATNIHNSGSFTFTPKPAPQNFQRWEVGSLRIVDSRHSAGKP